MNCSVDGCEKVVHARGYCPAHYQRWRVTGDAQPDKPLVSYQWGVDAETRFFNAVDDSAGEDGCHPWVAARDSNGYGRFRVGENVVLSTRWILGHLRGRELDPNEHACHKCDNPPCVNPKHLYIGTHADNMRDIVKRGHYNAEKTECKRGHPLSGDNLYVIPGSGSRVCRTCQRLRAAGELSSKRI